MADTRSGIADLVLLLLLATLWGASYSFIRVGVETIPPLTLIAARTLIAGSVLMAVMMWRGLLFPKDRLVWKRFLFQACLNSVIPFVLIAWAQQTTGAALATILNSTTPIFAFLFTVLVTRHEMVTGRKLFGVSLGMLGICFIIGLDALSGLGAHIGSQLAIVLAAAFYACAAIFGRNFKGMAPIVVAAGSMVCGAAILLPVSLVIDQPWTLQPSVQSLVALVGLSVFSTALAFVIYFRLLHTLGTVGTTAQAYLRVPIGVGFGIILLGESLSSTAFIGLVCVIAGVASMTIPARKVPPTMG
jgi:drug/metabolite transporter (DMT)-like permease